LPLSTAASHFKLRLSARHWARGRLAQHSSSTPDQSVKVCDCPVGSIGAGGGRAQRAERLSGVIPPKVERGGMAEIFPYSQA
jgi:hypothetical protein